MDLKLDETTGDIEIVDNEVSLTSGLESKRQSLLIRLSTFLGEWFLDETVGLPYYQDVLVKNPDFQAVSAAFKTIILDTPGILELLEFNLEFTGTRELTFEFRCRSEDGDIDFNKIIEV